jgi:hypothetical protein
MGRERPKRPRWAAQPRSKKQPPPNIAVARPPQGRARHGNTARAGFAQAWPILISQASASSYMPALPAVARLGSAGAEHDAKYIYVIRSVVANMVFAITERPVAVSHLRGS